METPFIVVLYSLVGLIEVVAYTPQVYKLVTAKDKGNELAISTFILWFFTSAIAVSYALLHAKDYLFAAVSGVHLVGCGLIVSISIYNHHFRFKQIKHDRRSSDTKKEA